MLAIFFHNARPDATAVAGDALLTPLTSSSQPSSSQPSASSAVSVKQEMKVKDEHAVSGTPHSSASARQVPYLGALAACELFASFASALCLPLPVIERVMDLLMLAAAPAAGASPLPVKPPQSIDEEVFLSIIRSAYGLQHNRSTSMAD